MTNQVAHGKRLGTGGCMSIGSWHLMLSQIHRYSGGRVPVRNSQFGGVAFAHHLKSKVFEPLGIVCRDVLQTAVDRLVPVVFLNKNRVSLALYPVIGISSNFVYDDRPV